MPEIISSKISAIKNERERHFASTFFEHDEWDHHPRQIIFNGGRYTADFFDKRRGIYIEVVGSRQAFAQNKYKYLYIMETCKNISLEFRSHEGRLLDPYNFSLTSNGGRWPGPSREQIYKEHGVLPDGYIDATSYMSDLKYFFLATNMKQSEAVQLFDVPPHCIDGILQGCTHCYVQNVVLIKSKYAIKIRAVLDEWEKHPENFPARRGWATSLTKKILNTKPGAHKYYCPMHPARTYFDDTPPYFKRRRKDCCPTPPTTPSTDQP